MEKLKLNDIIYSFIGKQIFKIYTVIKIKKTTAIAREKYFDDEWHDNKFLLDIINGQCQQYEKQFPCEEKIEYYLETPELKQKYEKMNKYMFLNKYNFMNLNENTLDKIIEIINSKII